MIKTKFNIKRPKNISKFKTNNTVLIEANIAYLLRLKKPVRIIQKLNIIESRVFCDQLRDWGTTCLPMRAE